MSEEATAVFLRSAHALDPQIKDMAAAAKNLIASVCHSAEVARYRVVQDPDGYMISPPPRVEESILLTAKKSDVSLIRPDCNKIDLAIAYDPVTKAYVEIATGRDAAILIAEKIAEWAAGR